MSKTIAEGHACMREAISDLVSHSAFVAGQFHEPLRSEADASRFATNVSLIAARVISIWLVVLIGCDSSAPKPIPPVSTSTTKGITSAEDEAILRRLCTQCHLYVEPARLVLCCELPMASRFAGSLRPGPASPGWRRTRSLRPTILWPSFCGFAASRLLCFAARLRERSSRERRGWEIGRASCRERV